jgi:hypothetical protein
MDPIEQEENICEGGGLNGHEFTLRLYSSSTEIGCPKGGYYRKSAITNERGQVIWHWHSDKEKES